MTLKRIKILFYPMDKDFLKKIDHLKKLVEAKSKLPMNETFKQREFEILIDLIYHDTKIRLSLSTVKRLWKPDYTGTPHPSTLDALARFAGFENWYAFSSSDEYDEKNTSMNSLEARGDVPTGKLKWATYAAILSVIVTITVLIVVLPEKEPQFSLSTGLIASDTLPAEVSFAVSVKGRTKDSLFLIPTLRPKKRIHVNQGLDTIDFSYRTPGYFDVYLEYANKLVDSSQVLVKTKGWIAAVYNYNSRNGANIESYFNENEISRNDILNISREDLEARDISIDGNLFTLYYFVSDPFKMDYDNFVLETRIKADSVYNFPTPYFYISIVTLNGMEFIPFTHMVTDRDHAVSFNDSFLEGLTNDLSNLAIDVDKWNDIRIENLNKHIRIYVNGKESLSFAYKKPMKPICGINFTFLGSGSVEGVRLLDTENKAIFEGQW